MNKKSSYKYGKKYSTDHNFTGYVEIASQMTEEGYPMNHSSARSYFLKGMRKIAKEILMEAGMEEGSATKLAREKAKDPDFQIAIFELLNKYGW